MARRTKAAALSAWRSPNSASWTGARRCDSWGPGKSHLAVALDIEAIRTGRSVSFRTLADLVTALVRAEREGFLRERRRFLCRP